ncbi:MAG: nucleotidyltransferase domain-containing protein [Methanomassiliicoccaceae archaeon]|nr:nucleotidyltransferase domain-containing protein [Methanomassiliicoccaceae archaeon]
MSPEIRKKFSIEELKVIVTPVAKKYGVNKVYLFGSVARGDFDENSDYDFCIERGKIECTIVLSEFFHDLHEAIGDEIDLVTTKSVNQAFLNNIMKDGVLIYG